MKAVIIIIVKFLKKQLVNNSLSPDAAEGVEVAVQCLENAYSITPEDMEECPVELEDIFLASTQSQEAGRVVTQEQMEEAESLKVLGNNLMKIGDYSEAIEYYTRCIELNPKNPVYFCNRAAGHIQSNGFLAAINDCHEAIRLDPKYSKAHSRLGYAYQAVGNRAKAKVHYARAHELEPENESYKSCHQKLADQGASSSRPVSDLMGMLPNIDLSAIMKNPSFVQMASQMLEDPGMQNAFKTATGQSPLEPSSVRGQQLADRLQNRPDNQQAPDEGTSNEQPPIDSEGASGTQPPQNSPRLPPVFSATDDDSPPDSMGPGGERCMQSSDGQGHSGKKMGDKGDNL